MSSRASADSRPGARARFVVTALLLVAARALDALTTYIAAPDLAREANPLQQLLHVGWFGLLLVNAIVLGVMIGAAWRASFSPPPLPRDSGLDLEAFVARFWFSRDDRRSILQAVFWLPADRRVRWAFIGGPGAVLVIVASVGIAIWNLLVARRVIVGPRAAHLGPALIWAAIILGLVLSVWVFLRAAYARYARYSGYAHTASVS